MTLIDVAVPGLVVSVSVERTTSVVRLRGEGDLATLQVLVSVLARVLAEDEGAVVVDLGEAGFFDTASARVVGRAAQYLDTRGRRLTIRAASRQAVMVLAAFRLSHLLDLGATGSAATRTACARSRRSRTAALRRPPTSDSFDYRSD